MKQTSQNSTRLILKIIQNSKRKQYIIPCLTKMIIYASSDDIGQVKVNKCENTLTSNMVMKKLIGYVKGNELNAK